jgi:hypothetical protein
MTRFRKGQHVISCITAQGLHLDTIYRVVGVQVRPTPWGEFVTYELTDGEQRLRIANGHLILREA